MATEEITDQAVVEKKEKKKDALFSKKNRKIIADPMDDQNPITVQVLGICSALAITVQVEQAVVMTLAVTFVLVSSNVIISLLRKMIPSKVRIIVQLIIIASLVVFVDELLKAYMYGLSKQLTVFVGLIITNCIIMGRAEAFAMQNNVKESMYDGFGNAFGYGMILIIVSIFRELLGSGTLLNYQMVSQQIFWMWEALQILKQWLKDSKSF